METEIEEEKGFSSKLWAKYFENLGYKYDWDLSVSQGDEWHEILKNGKLILQVQNNVSLSDFINEMLKIKESNVNYWYFAEDEEAFQEIIENIRGFEYLKKYKK